MNASEMPTPRTDKAIRRTQGMFRAASAANGFTEHSRQLERELTTLRKAAEAAAVSMKQSLSQWKHYAEDREGENMETAEHMEGRFYKDAKQALASLRSELEGKTTPAIPETPAPRPD